jgi:hypothetical protein
LAVSKITGETPVLREGRNEEHEKGADTGIDGYINFFDPSAFARGGERKSNRDKSGRGKQVMSAYVGANHVRDLRYAEKTLKLSS